MLRGLAEKIFSWPGYRWGWLVVIILSLLVIGVSAPLAGKFESAQKNQQSDFLPKNSESVRVSQAQLKLPGADKVTASLIIEKEGAITGEDKQKIERLKAVIKKNSPRGTTISPPTPASSGEAQLITVSYPGEGSRKTLESLSGTLEKLREQAAVAGDNKLTIKVGGQLGFAGDSIKIFKSINSTLLYATGLLVLILLLLIYRSPIFWILPLGAVVGAEILARAGGYLLAKSGVVVTGQSAGILSVLVFGAGTDYALLLVSRYREELRTEESTRRAMQVALQKTGPTIIASGGTVVAGLLCLQLAQVNAIAGLGPAGAIGILAAMISATTLLPALLLAGGRKAFWPLIPRLGSKGANVEHGAWRRVGEWVERRRGLVIVLSIAMLAVMALGLPVLRNPLTADQDFRGKVESVQAQKMIERSFPAGSSAPALVLLDKSKAGKVRSLLAGQRSVASVSPAATSPSDNSRTLIGVILRSDPGGSQALKDIKQLRKSLAGTGALIGGSAAQELDLREATHRDNKLLIPVITLLVLFILMVLLRSIIMPLILTGTVILSFVASLGAVSWISVHLLGAPGVPASLPIISFVFLVALGIDYNIFLAARAREESATWGSREGMLRALAVTGAVITSAGVVLAGTFSVLTVLPLWTLTEIGLAVAFGVLLDTILVRSLLVPAITWSLGDRSWWPWRPGQK